MFFLSSLTEILFYPVLSKFSILKLGMVAHTCDPNTKGLGKKNCNELQASLGYIASSQPV